MTLRRKRMVAIQFLRGWQVAEVQGKHDRRKRREVVRRVFFECGCAIMRPGCRAARKRVGSPNSKSEVCELHRRRIGQATRFELDTSLSL